MKFDWSDDGKHGYLMPTKGQIWYRFMDKKRKRRITMSGTALFKYRFTRCCLKNIISRNEIFGSFIQTYRLNFLIIMVIMKRKDDSFTRGNSNG
ncbi:hypothetical protein DT065_03930 [Salicibibacter kimchii]|uniref:Uncharacterized protein n=1 Tax=Salicibibacter kimchii TaxID=2099786 RepID=A0A345BWB9_9BACI|nr:hypothetical protein DT065_03930 [Salicibibacter kimchii]